MQLACDRIAEYDLGERAVASRIPVLVLTSSKPLQILAKVASHILLRLFTNILNALLQPLSRQLVAIDGFTLIIEPEIENEINSGVDQLFSNIFRRKVQRTEVVDCVTLAVDLEEILVPHDFTKHLFLLAIKFEGDLSGGHLARESKTLTFFEGGLLDGAILLGRNLHNAVQCFIYHIAHSLMHLAASLIGPLLHFNVHQAVVLPLE